MTTDRPPGSANSFTIDEWCVYRRVSRGGLYNMWKAGIGPRYYHNGSRRLISVEADAAWLAEREAAAKTAA